MMNDRRLKWVLAAVGLVVGCGRGGAPGPRSAAPEQRPVSSPVLPGIDPQVSAPQILAVGFLNTAVNTRDVAMTPEGRRFFPVRPRDA